MVGLTLPLLSLSAAVQQPNVLWLDAEDANVNWFGSYGNDEVTTPNLDQLAEEGFRYRHAFANAPVCSPSRSTWITGVLSVSNGTLPMRSRNAIPHDTINYYPDYLREAGYYVTQPGKTDYNIGGREDRDAWNEGDWGNRKPGQPFFHVAHFPESHESRAFGDVNNSRHDPAKQRLRAYHPDIPRIRNNYAHYADQVERLDEAIGKWLDRLDEEGLADDTIVIFTTDHGGVMPGSKRYLKDSGTHSPLIIRIPEKFKNLWPADAPGEPVDRLVSFVDMPKTWLSITGAKVPDYMDGRIFLGPDTEPARETHFAFAGRMVNRYLEMRAVRDKRFLYIKNYMPYVPIGQEIGYLWRMEAAQAWDEHHQAGKTDAITGAFFDPRPPVEELYDTTRDPDNVINLAHRPEHQGDLETLRAALREWQLESHDAGVLAEEIVVERAEKHGITIHELVRNPDLYDLPAYLDAADIALEADPENRKRLVRMLAHEDAGLRYWGVVGLLILGDPAPAVTGALVDRLQDESDAVRAMAAWALIDADEEKAAARSCLISLLDDASLTTLLVLNIIDLTHDDVSVYREAIEGAIDSPFGGNYARRMKNHLLD